MAYTSDKKIQPSNIKYTSKDFNTIKSDLIEYTKSYFPDTYKDFNETSPGMMLIELSSYVGDVLSYYIDYNYKENVLTTATEKRNVLNLAHFLGYKHNSITPSTVELTLTKDVSKVNNEPNYSEGVQTIDSGFQVTSNIDSELIFETLDIVDFKMSGSYPIDDAKSQTYSANGETETYRITRKVTAVSGKTKTKTFTITSPTKFLELDLGESNVIEILNCIDSSGQKWYEVDYLAQSRLLKETHYSNGGRSDSFNQGDISDTDSLDVAIPYTLDYIKTNKKFVRKVDVDTNNTKLVFGNGLYKYNISGSSNSIGAIIEQQGINVAGVSMSTINASINNILVNNSINLGETPSNTMLTVTYRVGGGALSNTQSGEITEVVDGTNVIVTNIEPANGGTDGMTVDEIKHNSKAFFATQLRCVTKEDYQARILTMPAKFGNIAKCYVERGASGNTLNIRTLSYNKNKQLVNTPPLVFDNLQKYLEQFRMINDNLDFGVGLLSGISNNVNKFSGHWINFGVQFDVTYDRRFVSTGVKLEVIDVIKEFFKIEKMQFKQSINLNDLEYEIIGLDGVIGIKELKLFQINGDTELFNYDKNGDVLSATNTVGYGFKYHFDNLSTDGDESSSIINKIVRPSVEAAVFEIRNPNTDIQGKVS
jgi:hypothetical protein